MIEVTKALSSVEIKAVECSGHSFRIGTVTMAAEKGVQDLIINKDGRALPKIH